MSEDLSQTVNEDYSVTSPSILPSSASDTTSHQSKKRKYDKVSDILIENREARSKLLEALNNNSEKQDDVDIFYKSIAMSVKRLSPILIAEAKMKHLQTLNDLELKHMQSVQQYQQTNYLNQHVQSQAQEPPVNLSYQNHQLISQPLIPQKLPSENSNYFDSSYLQLESQATTSQTSTFYQNPK